MSAAEVLAEARKLSRVEMLELLEALEAELTPKDDELTPEQMAELERRALEARDHPEDSVPWEKVRAEVQALLTRPK